ncbi:putative secreted protein [Vibrio mimicus VM223]|nr:putative secreted protein [Vibrio mimicus VM223]
MFRYSPYFSQGSDRIIIDSDVIIATFDAANQDFTFDMPKYRDAPQATKAIKKMEWQLVDQQGKAIEMRQDRLIKEGIQLGRNFEFETAEYNRKGGIAALTSSIATQPLTQQEASNAAASAAEEMLHFWYNKADEETKARFKAFVNKQ